MLEMRSQSPIEPLQDTFTNYCASLHRDLVPAHQLYVDPSAQALREGLANTGINTDISEIRRGFVAAVSPQGREKDQPLIRRVKELLSQNRQNEVLNQEPDREDLIEAMVIQIAHLDAEEFSWLQRQVAKKEREFGATRLDIEKIKLTQFQKLFLKRYNPFELSVQGSLNMITYGLQFSTEQAGQNESIKAASTEST